MSKLPLVEKAGAKLASLGVPYESLEISSRPGKKLMVEIAGKKIHFGQAGSKTYLEGAPAAKRDAYRARHSKIKLKDGSSAINEKYSPAWLSWHVLW